MKVIWESWSSWSAPIIVVPKGDRGKCLVINYCTLSRITQKFIWAMPKVEDIFSQLNRAKYFSTLDLWPGCHHIPLDESSITKTAFTSPFGKYEYNKVPFGLTQAPAFFQELMTGVLKDFSPLLLTWMTSSSSAGQQKNTSNALSKFSKNYGMHTYQWNLANATFSLKKSRTSDTSSAPQVSDHYHQKPKL